MRGLNDALLMSGVGSFVGFLVAVLLYEPLKNESMVYLIPVGLLIGLFLSGKLKLGFRASPYAFPLGILVALLLVFLWVPSTSLMPLYLALGVTVGAMLYLRPSNLWDSFLVPITYIGGFVLVMLLVKNYPPVRENEYAVPVLFSVAGSGAVLAFLSSLARWGFEFARKLASSGGGNV